MMAGHDIQSLDVMKAVAVFTADKGIAFQAHGVDWWIWKEDNKELTP